MEILSLDYRKRVVFVAMTALVMSFEGWLQCTGSGALIKLVVVKAAAEWW